MLQQWFGVRDEKKAFLAAITSSHHISWSRRPFYNLISDSERKIFIYLPQNNRALKYLSSTTVSKKVVWAREMKLRLSLIINYFEIQH